MSFDAAKLFKGSQPVVRGKQDPKFPVTTECGEESKVQTHFQASCDINNIAKSQQATGSPDQVRNLQERYGDFTEIFNVAENLNRAAKAQQTFEQLPAEVRKKAGNSIEGFFEFIQEPENKTFCQKWGIFEKDSPPKQQEPSPGSKKDGSPKKLKVDVSPTEE